MGTGTSARPGRESGDGAQEKAQEVLGQAQEKGQRAASEAKSRLREQLDQRSSQAAERIDQQASDLRAVSDSLREQGKDGPADAAGKLARSAERVGGYVREKDSDALLSDVEDLARRQPWAMGAGAMALGFVASRFLKASSSKRYSARYGQRSLPEPAASSEASTPPRSEPTMVAGEVSPPVGGTPDAAAVGGIPDAAPASRSAAGGRVSGLSRGAPSQQGTPGA